ncbi:MAG TPA: glycosyltransferase family 2 protein [Terracidiphilus sp.]|nr:glycosyltransferase family 2 protein [Terracidiphilus sp.]
MDFANQLTVGIVTYNSAGVIEGQLESLQFLPNIIVADNDSCDETVAKVSSAAPRVDVISSKSNLGFGKAANQILARASTDYVLILNPDCQVSVECIAELGCIATMNPDAAIIAPVLRYNDGRPQKSFLPFDPTVFSGQFKHRFLPVKHVLGAAMLLRRSAIMQMGGFDEAYFLYCEDEDLCVRVLRAGHKILLAPSAQAVHVYGHSSSEDATVRNLKAWHMGWSRARFAFRSDGVPGLVRRLLKTIGRSVLDISRAVAGGNGSDLSEAWTTLRGTFAFLCGKDAYQHARPQKLPADATL